MPRAVPKSLALRLARVRIFLCDVDGVLTDATVLMGDGREFKRFDIQDGLGLRLLQNQGIRVGWVSARPSPVTQQRAKDLKIDFLHQDHGSKVVAVENILQKAGLGWEQVCFVVDDVVDLGAAADQPSIAHPTADVPERQLVAVVDDGGPRDRARLQHQHARPASQPDVGARRS